VPARLPATAALVAAAAIALALASALHSGRSVWRRLNRSHTEYARLSDTVRRRLPLEEIGVSGAAFDFYASYVGPGDRVYFQVRPGGPNAATLAAAGRFYLLPATETASLADATVVASYDDDPSLLHVSFVTQRQDGRQPVYVSRISSP
jgi:hypothetical protein